MTAGTDAMTAATGTLTVLNFTMTAATGTLTVLEFTLTAATGTIQLTVS